MTSAVATALVFLLTTPASAAITGTGTCAGIPGTLTSNFTCNGDVYIDGGSTLNIGNNTADVTLDVGSGTICVGFSATAPCNTLTGSGTIVVDPSATYGTILTANLIVASGSVIRANGTGCGPSLSFDVTTGSGCVDKVPTGSIGVAAGFGEGSNANGGAGGGGHGGAGGNGGSGRLGGYAYGSSTTPLEMGSGGGNSTTGSPLGGSGGGAIYIDVTGTLTVDGTMSSNGTDGVNDARSTGGGSGGGIYVITSNLAGSGSFQANGGKGGNAVSPGSIGAGGGGGGRIAVYYTGSNSFGGTLSCTGGAGGSGTSQGANGGTGTCPAPTSTTIATTLGDGTDPAIPPVAPGSTDQYLDQFTFVTNSRTDSVTSLTVTTTSTAAIASMKIMSDDMTTQYFGTLSSPTGADTWTFSGGTIPVRVKSSPDAFWIVVDFKTQAQLDAIGKVLYLVTGHVTAFTTTIHPTAGTDNANTTITVDNQPPADATWGTISVGDSQIILNWTNPADSDFAEVVILRNTASITDAPTDGVAYTAGGTIGISTIVYVGNGTTFTDTGVVNGTGYFYKIFSRDVYLNYASGASTGPHTPVLAVCNTIPNPLTTDFTCTGNLTVPDDTGGISLAMNGDIRLRVKGLLTVKSGYQIVVDPLNTYGTIVADNLEVQTGGFIDANGTGCGSSLGFNVTTRSGCTNLVADGPGQGRDNTGNGGGGGAGYGGAGGKVSGNPDTAGGTAYGTPDLTTIMMGSGGGTGSSGNAGGAGGGAINLEVSGTLTVDGAIRANGNKGSNLSQGTRGGGGGSGGSLHITAGTLAGAGLIQVNGGDGGDGTLNGGGGAGGRIYIACTTCLVPVTPSTVQAIGGVPGAVGTDGEVGQAGSIYVIKDNFPLGFGSEDDLTIGGNGPLNGLLNINNLTVIQVGNSGDATRDQGTIIVAGDITAAVSIAVKSGGNLSTSGIRTITAPTVTLDRDGSINADGLGCPASQSYDPAMPGCVNKGAGVITGFGEGGDDTVGNRGAGGAGYGGAGGDGTGTSAGLGGFSYGDPELTQIMLGSGGGSNPDNSILGGVGGGAVNINVSGTLTVDGTISANGSPGSVSSGNTSGGGSGGSVYITAGTLAGTTTGFIRANGGDGGNVVASDTSDSGGGGGGRMRVEITGDNTFRGACEALPGNAFIAGSGQSGSIIFRARPDGTIDGFGLDQFDALGTGNGGESTRTTQAGRTATYSLRLYNKDPFCSTETHTYHLSGTIPAGWSVEVEDNAGSKHTLPFDTGALHGATFADFTVRVTPSTTAAAGIFDLILDIQTNSLDSNFVDSVRIRVKVAGADGIIDGKGDNIYGAVGTGKGGQSSRDVTANVTTSYSLAVQNDSGVPESYNITWTLPTGWTTTIQELSTTCAASSCSATTPSIGGGVTALYTFNVTPPVGATTQTIILNIVSTTRPADSVDSVTAIAAMVSGPPAAPTACTGAGVPSAVCLAPSAISSSQIKVYWVDNSNNETGFRIERADGACSTFSVIYTLLRDTVGSTSTGQLLGYTDSGLSPSTTYCYRFQAFNSAGDSAYSSAVSGTTLAAALDAIPPGTVADLAVEPGTQRYNSMTLTWTAPPDDASVPGVGSATGYDLRYSMLPILDGPADAHTDHVHFNDTICTDSTQPADCVVPMTGEPTPHPAGQPERFTVTGRINNAGECDGTLTDLTRPPCLTSNTIYYFALKSKDKADNVSVLSNLAGGDNPTSGTYSGRTALRTGFNLVSIPLVRDSGTVSSASATTLTDSSKIWQVNQWASGGVIFTVTITGGKGSGQVRTIVSNTTDTLTVAAAWTILPDATSAYRVTSDAVSIFADDIGGTPSLSRWNSSGLGIADGCYEASPVDGSTCSPRIEITTVSPGLGYFLLGGSNNPVIDVPAGSAPVATSTLCGIPNSYAIPLQLGWNIIGDPFTKRVPLDGTTPIRIRYDGNDTTCKTFQTAAVAGDIGGAIYYGFNGSSYVLYQTCNLTGCTAVIEPWQGYWMQVNGGFTSTIELIVPQPP